MERLEVQNSYSSFECAIHLARYNFAKQFCKNKKVLDLSCGEGYGSYILSLSGCKEVIGIDISKESIALAKKNYKNNNLKYMVSNACNLKDIDDNYFDVIVSFETMEHIDKVDGYFKEIKRVSKKDGIIIISCPNDFYYYPSVDEFNIFHKRKYTFNDFKGIAESFLGNNVEYFLGMETMGYININPQKTFKVDNNLEMLKADNKVELVKLSPEREIDYNVCNYYIGIWNAKKIKENATCFPYMYVDWKKSSDILNRDVKMLSGLLKEANNYNENITKELNDLQEKNQELRNQIDRLKKLNTILYNKNEEAIKFNMMNYEYLNAILNSRSYKLIQKLRRIIGRK